MYQIKDKRIISDVCGFETMVATAGQIIGRLFKQKKVLTLYHDIDIIDA